MAKAGFAGNDAPRAVFPSIEALWWIWHNKMRMLVMKHKVNVIFYFLNVQLNIILLTEAPMNPNANTEKMTPIVIGDNMSEINNENFYDSGYYATPTPVSRAGFVFNVVCNGV